MSSSQHAGEQKRRPTPSSARAQARVDWLERTARGERGLNSIAGHLVPLGLSAVLLALAFPQPGWGWLAHVALVPAAVVALRSANAVRLTWCMAVVFVIWWVVMLRWLAPVTAGGYVLLAGFMAMWWVLALLGLRWLHTSFRMAAVLALPLMWVGIEVLRDHVPAGGFGWYILGYTQAGFGPEQEVGRLVQVADLFGVYGVSALVAMTNGLIADVLTRPLTFRTSEGKVRPGGVIAAGAAGWLAATLLAWGYGQYRIAEHQRVAIAGPRVAVVQTNVPQSNKIAPTIESRQRDWDELMALTQKAARYTHNPGQDAAAEPAPNLIVWPETVVPTALNAEARRHMPDASAYHEALHELAEVLDVPLLVGAQAYGDFTAERLPTGRTVHIPRRSHNSVYLYHPDTADHDGESHGNETDSLTGSSERSEQMRYDKVHRVPFGEYVPWVEAAPALKELFITYLTPYDHDYTVDAGNTLTVFELPTEADTSAPTEAAAPSALRFATPICFEDSVGRMCRRMVYGDEPGDARGGKRVDALLNLTNDGWFLGGAMRAQHMQMAAMRTIENRVPMARSVNTGNSGFINSLGRIGPVVESEDGRRHGVAGVVEAELTLDPRQTLYGRLGEWPAWTVTAVALVLALGGGLRLTRIGAAKSPSDDQKLTDPQTQDNADKAQ